MHQKRVAIQDPVFRPADENIPVVYDHTVREPLPIIIKPLMQLSLADGFFLMLGSRLRECFKSGQGLMHPEYARQPRSLYHWGHKA